MHLIALGFAPGIYWLWFFIKKDKWNPEPKAMILKAYFLGIFSTILVLLVQLPCKFSYLTGAVLVAPILEESVKFMIVLFFFYPHREFDEPIDGIIYASAVALGFASIENVFYMFGVNSQSRYLLPGVILVRSLLSVPGHALFSSIWGYALGKVKFTDSRKKHLLLGSSLILAMIAHGLFNLFCLIGNFFSAGLLILIVLLWVLLSKNIRKAIGKTSYFAPK
ncbi:MAG: PrsW family intramembrane metalloprotease [Candidatus Cloacimonetes bacterium]|nr:PrsW family intramembrane metalloprotease [Candidatus Cloacimonadota bacterium]